MNFIQNLFQSVPSTEFSYYIPMIVLIVILIIKAVIWSRLYAAKRKNDIAFRRQFRNTSGHLGLFAALFTILMLVRYERIPYFSMRIWLYIVVLCFLYFSVKTTIAYFKHYPREKMNYATKGKSEPNTKEKVYSTKKKRK